MYRMYRYAKKECPGSSRNALEKRVPIMSLSFQVQELLQVYLWQKDSSGNEKSDPPLS